MKKILYFSLMFATKCFMAQVDLTTGLKVCMPFTGNANDLSGNGNNGTVSGATLTTDRMGNANSAYLFDRNNTNNISVSSFATIAPTNELTISMWAKSNATTANCLFMLSPDDPNDRCVGCAQYSNAGSTMMIWDYGNISIGGRSVVQSIPIDVSNWHHYVYVVSQGGNFKKMYLDGVANLSAAYGLSCMNKNLPLYIGGGLTNGGTAKIIWDGKIDDVNIYNRALTQADISALFAGTKACNVSTVGFDDLRAIEDLVVYQSGSGGAFTVRSNLMTTADKIAVYTIDGKLIMQKSGETGELQIDLGHVPNGVYILKLSGEKGIFSRKIIKD